jgi:hypothetical protein
MSGKFLQGAVSRGLREAGAAMRQEAGVMEVSFNWCWRLMLTSPCRRLIVFAQRL